MNNLLFVAIFSLVASVSAARGCGVDRWPVKTGSDADIGQVNLTPVPTTIANLVKLPIHVNPEQYQNSRIPPYEFKSYSLTATLIEVLSESDQDLHLVLKDATGHTMIVESPYPGCASNSSRIKAQIAAVRAAINKSIPPSVIRSEHESEPVDPALKPGERDSAADTYPDMRENPPPPLNMTVTVTGIAMFDTLHGQTGVAPNGIELHSLLSFATP